MNYDLSQKALQLSRLTADFIKISTGKGPKNIKSNFLDNLGNKVLIEFDNYLTPLELEISKDSEGFFSVKQARDRYTEKIRDEYLDVICKELGLKVITSSTAWNIRDNEGFILLKLATNQSRSR